MRFDRGKRALALFFVGGALVLASVADPIGASIEAAYAEAPVSGSGLAAARLGLDAPPAVPEAVVGYAATRQALVTALESGEPRFLMPLGGSSGVLRMRMSESWAAVYRLRTHRRPDGPVAEVVAYRVALALGLDNVPPAVLRRMPEADVRRRFSGTEEQWEALRRVLAVGADGAVVGAAIAYQTELEHLGLEQTRRRDEWRGWLRHGAAIPEEAQLLARDLSRMIAFDYLVANRDRAHDPLRGPKDGSRIVLRNHDAAFAPLTAVGERQLLEALRATERFSRSMIAGLVALDREALIALSTQDGEPLLPAAHLDAVLERRETILSYVEALCDRYGTEDVLFFP